MQKNKMDSVSMKAYTCGISKEDFVNDYQISTVFLGVDYRYPISDKPILFETMIFRKDLDEYQRRCSTWDEAIESTKKR